MKTRTKKSSRSSVPPPTIKRTKPSKPQYDILTSKQQVNLFLAGQGSGKTHCAGLLSGYLKTNFPGVRGFIGANTKTQLTDSTLFRIRTVWREIFGWTEWDKSNPNGNYTVNIIPPSHFNTDGHEFDSYRNKICFLDGTVIFIGSLENYKAHDGKEFAWAILDETKDTREEAVKEVILGRLRQPGMVDHNGNGWNPLFIFTSPAKVQWINEWFRLDDFEDEIVELIYSEDTYFVADIDNKRVVISSTYHNKENLPDTYIPNQKRNLHSGLQDMLIYGNPFSQSGGEFYKQFVRAKQVVANPVIGGTLKLYNDSLPLQLTFDFNVNPYITLAVWQMYDRNDKEAGFDKLPSDFLGALAIPPDINKIAVQIDEICLSNPSNTTPALCKEFSRKYAGHVAGVLIYGDPAGEHEDTRVEKREEKKYNDFNLIKKHLNHFKPSMRVDKAAPPVVMRGNFINTVFELNFAGLAFFIGDNCKKSIADYQYGKEAADGRKLKEMETDPDTGVKYQKHHHITDANDYFICRVYAQEFRDYQKGPQAVEITTYKIVRTKHNY